MCAVPNMAVFCSSLTSWFPGMLFTYFLNVFEIVLVAPIITGITFVFIFHMCCISIVRSLYIIIIIINLYSTVDQWVEHQVTFWNLILKHPYEPPSLLDSRGPSQLAVQCVPTGLPKQLTNHYNLFPKVKCVDLHYNSAILQYGLQNRHLQCYSSSLWIYWLCKLLSGRLVYVLCHWVSLTIFTSSFLLLCMWCLFVVIVVSVIDRGRNRPCLIRRCVFGFS